MANNEWLKRYARACGVTPEKAEQDWATLQEQVRDWRVRCQARRCRRPAAPFCLPYDERVTVLRYFCPKHWLLAAEEVSCRGLSLADL